MASKGRDAASVPACTVCGGELNDAWECTICGTKHEPQGRAKARELTEQQAVELFTQISGVGESKARALYENGYTTVDSLKAAPLDALAKIPGIGDRLAKTIHDAAPRLLVSIAANGDGGNGAAPTNGGGRDALSQWLTGGGDPGLNVWLGGPKPGGQTDEALKRWLTGEDGALSSWLGDAMPPAPGAPGGARVRDNSRLIEEKDRELRAREVEMEGLRTELDTIRRMMSSELESFKTGAFDPMKYVEETARLNKELGQEVKLRRQLEEEIDHVKKGSIAVIKYVKAQQLKAGAASPEIKRKLAEEGNARRRLEIEVKRSAELLANLQKQMQMGLGGLKPDERALKQREFALIEKEATLKAKEEELSAFEAAARSGEVDLNGSTVSEELRSRLTEELREKEQEFLTKEEELRKKIIGLEEEVNQFSIEAQLRAESAALAGKPKGEVDAILAKKEQELQTKEKSILIREKEIQRLKDELEFTKDELGKIKQQVGYKDEELLRREEDLLYREKILTAERRKIEDAKAQGFSTEEKDLKDRLEQLKLEINAKEEEVRSKEKFLKSKMEELRLREQGLVEEEIEAREEDRLLEVKQDKIKTGTPRLDDLLLGGIPFGSNVSIYGPAYVGKEVIVNAFMAEGLKKGVPAIFILTDKTAGDIREEMAFVLPGFDVYEQKGLVRYIDAYSRSMGSEDKDQYTIYLDEPTDYEAILKAVDELTREYKKKYEYYRLCFRSVSTLIAYLDPSTMFKFLQPFTGRRKRDKAVAMYIIEKGMHGEQEIQMLGSLMDGSVEIKVEQLKSYLAVKGIADVQSRAWIRYTYSKQAVNIGSFSLDHIR